MNLNRCVNIPVSNFTADKFKDLAKLVGTEFPHYKLSYKEPFDFWEHVPNPDYKTNQCPPDEEEISIHREAECGLDLELKNARHSNWNISCFLYNNSIYIFQGVYYYAHCNADNLASLIQKFVLSDCLLADSGLAHHSTTYSEWVKKHPDQKFANHNYKIDKEDLEKIGIIV